MTTPFPPASGRFRMAAADGWRYGVITLIAFLTLVDLFAAQAILPSLVEAFGVSRAAMGFAVNASTFGMALASLGVAFFGRSIDRRNGIWISLVVLAVPTSLLAFTHDLTVFTLLRVAQGLCMATAFTLTMSYLAEHFEPRATTGALAAYVTGNVASNFFGRLMSASLADTFGLSPTFLVFAALNVAGGVLVLSTLKATERMMGAGGGTTPRRDWRECLGNPALRWSFLIGFLVLFVFIGTFTYVNFRLTADPIGLSPMALGLVYLVFLPSMVTTPLAGRLSAARGPSAAIVFGLGVAVLGLLMALSPVLAVALPGLALVAIGTFLAQAVVTGHVGRTAGGARTAASGIYLASYYVGGLAGGVVLGQVYDRVGWSACIAVLVVATALAAAAGLRLGARPLADLRAHEKPA
ncbi:MFS transporter [Aquibium sp. LZ166]|uniref:MFS transporter n=1 Tax=Aquibium pacificus TaxID=3153579 RepID=A0ABV3SNB8_9HYPH